MSRTPCGSGLISPVRVYMPQLCEVMGPPPLCVWRRLGSGCQCSDCFQHSRHQPVRFLPHSVFHWPNTACPQSCYWSPSKVHSWTEVFLPVSAPGLKCQTQPLSCDDLMRAPYHVSRIWCLRLQAPRKPEPSQWLSRSLHILSGFQLIDMLGNYIPRCNELMHAGFIHFTHCNV
jgi:hypothetical protein